MDPKAPSRLAKALSGFCHSSASPSAQSCFSPTLLQMVLPKLCPITFCLIICFQRMKPEMVLDTH